MALNGGSNLLLGASHFHHDYSHSRRHTSISDSSDILTISRLASSAQSLQAIYPSTPRPHSERSAERPPLTSDTSATIYRSPSTYPSLSHLNKQYPQAHTSLTQILTEDAPASKSSNAYRESAYLPNGPAIVPIDGVLIEKIERTEIRVRCVFLRIGEIDTLNERYTSEIFLEASWYAKDLKLEGKDDSQTGHFNPQIFVLNHMGDSLKHDKWYSINRTTDNGLVEVIEYHKFKGVFWERMELDHFPYDVQELSISLTTPLTTNEIYFVENHQKPSGVNRTVFSDQQSWHLYEHVEFQFEQYQEECTLNYDQLHPVLVCTCHVGRKCGYYVWNAYFLIFLITSAALCTFAIPPSNAHGRLQITCTLLLTSVTFRWVVNKSLPTISYLTALDIYAIASIVALCVINVFHGAVSYIYYNQIYLASQLTPTVTNALHLSLYPEYNLCRLDRYGFFALCVAFLFYQILILSWTFWSPYKRRQVMAQKDEKYREEFMSKLGNHQSSNGK